MNLRQNLNSAEIFGGLRDLTRNARLSVFETVFLAAALLFAAFVAFFYFTKVQPLNSQVASLQEREREMRSKLDRMNTDEKKRIDQASNAEKILDSLSKFEKYLKPDERGMTQIINEIDSLGRTHKILVGDASYRVAEPEVAVDESGAAKPVSNDKKVNVYPALGIDTTVIGDYTNLRRFLLDLERSKQFLIINSLSFQGEADKFRRPPAPIPAAAAGPINPGAGPGNVAKGPQLQLNSPASIPVSLKIELDTYFQKTSGRGQ